MDWIQSLSKAIHYIENNLTNDISVDDVSNHVYASSFNFQRIFNLVTGMTIGDYIRNRRLSCAGQELLYTKHKIIDVAMRYQYDTQESFSKAFTRFHGLTPASVRKQKRPIWKSPFSLTPIHMFKPGSCFRSCYFSHAAREMITPLRIIPCLRGVILPRTGKPEAGQRRIAGRLIR